MDMWTNCNRTERKQNATKNEYCNKYWIKLYGELIFKKQQYDFLIEITSNTQEMYRTVQKSLRTKEIWQNCL